MSFETFFGSDKFNLYQTITPFKGSKKSLLCYRLFALIILFIGLFGSFYNAALSTKTFMWLPYFTNQTYTAIIIYFILGVLFYICDSFGKLNAKIGNSVLHTIVHLFYNVHLPLSFLVTVIFWGLIFPVIDYSFYTWTHWVTNVIQHFIQFVLIAIDWYLVTIPTNYHHFLAMFIIGIAYLIFAQIYHLLYDHWIYPFLVIKKDNYWYLLYPALVIGWSILGFIFVAIQKFKNRNRTFVTAENKDSKKYTRTIEMV